MYQGHYWKEELTHLYDKLCSHSSWENTEYLLLGLRLFIQLFTHVLVGKELAQCSHMNELALRTNPCEISTPSVIKLTCRPRKSVSFPCKPEGKISLQLGRFPSSVGWFPLCIILFFPSKSQTFLARSFLLCLFFSKACLTLTALGYGDPSWHK